MMIHKTMQNGTITLSLAGRLDSLTQADLARELEAVYETPFTALVIDLSALEYISSAGLRVLFSAQQKATGLGAKFRVTGASETVKEIFQITGFQFDE
jgi:anti-sigma B factor antagonist